MRKIIEDFLKYLGLHGVSASSLKYYKSDLVNFLTWVGEKKINHESIQKYIEEKRLTTPTSTLKRRLSTLRSFENFLGIKRPIKSWQDNILIKFSNKPKLYNFLRKLFFSRPNWYKKYHSYPLANYLHIAILVIFSSLSAYALYNQVFKNAGGLSAFPTALTRPNRYLSFQGRLTSNLGNPITSATNVVFKLYDAVSTGNTLWDSGTCSITPDSDGVFSTLLGSSCGTEITSAVFSENSSVWVGVTVAGDAEATPRIQIATVGYALNAETLQGYPASSSATINTIPVINNSGNLVIAKSSPKIQSTSGTFSVEGQALTITTPDTSNGVITVNPDGTGTLNLTFEGTAAGGGVNGFVNATNANITSGSLYGGTVASAASGYNFVDFQSGVSPASKFSVSSAGQITSAAGLTIGTTSLSETTSAVDSGAYLVGVFDEFDNSASSTVQAVLNDLDAAITTGSSWTLAGDSGTPQTISSGNTGTVAGGAGITTVAGATDTVTLTFASTELNDLTWGTGAAATVTWSSSLSGATDPTLAFGNDLITLTAGTTTLSGDLKLTGADILDTNGNEFLRFTSTASAVDEITIANAAANGTVTLAATGGDTDIAFSIDAKGADALNLNGTGTGDVAIAGGSVGTGCTITNSNGNLACSGTITGTITASSLPWSGLTSPTGALSLNMTTNGQYATTFGWTPTGALDAFTMNVTNNGGSSTTQDGLVINNAVAGSFTDTTTENLLLIQQLDTTSAGTTVVTNGIKVDSAGSSAMTNGMTITNSAGNLTTGISIADTAGGTLTTGIAITGTVTNAMDAGSFPIVNIGNSGTDFDSSGGLTLADNLTVGGIIENGLVAWWPIDEGTGTTITDYSLNTNTGTLGTSTATPTWTNGKFKNSLQFDGGDYVTVADDATLQTNNLTIEGWVKFTSTGWHTVAAKGNGLTTNAWWFGVDAANKVLLKFNGVSGSPYSPSTTINDSLWHHIVGTYDGTYIRVYVDGKLDNTPYSSSSISNKTGTLEIATSTYYGGFSWIGNIDELRIYNRALSEREVAENYRQNSSSIMNGGIINYSSAFPSLTIQQSNTAEQLRLAYGNESAYTGFTVDSNGDLTIDTTGGDIIFNSGDNLNLTASTDLIFGGSTSLGETTSAVDSGAYLVGVFDEFDNSASSTVQAVLNDLDSVLSTKGVGDITAVGSMLSGDVFADATADNDWLGLGASAGRIEFDDQTIDEINFLDTLVGIGTATPIARLHVNATSANSTGKSALIVDQNESQDILTASASGVTKLTLQNDGTLKLANTASTISNDAGNITITPAGGTVAVGGKLTITIDGSATAVDALCGDSTLDGDVGDSAGELISDCSGAPTADYAEIYPTKEDVYYGDIVVTSSEMVQIKKTENNKIIENEFTKISKLEKSTSSYQNSIIGITSNNYGDFTSTGHNLVDDSDNPLPVALNGRVHVKISNGSTAINIGDPISSSNDAGRGMKALEAGRIVGTALENWSPDNPKDTILVFVNNVYYDPTLTLNNSGDLNLDTTNSIAVITNTKTNTIINKIGAFKDLIASRIKAGRVETNLISPVTNSDLIIDLQPNNNEEASRLVIKGENDEDVISFDASGNATISGTLYADNIESEKLKKIEELLHQVETNQGLLTESKSWDINTATTSASLSASNSGQFKDLFVTGQTAMTSLFVSDNLTTKNINSLDSPLNLQPLALNNIELMAGKITIDTSGNAYFSGDVEVAGNLTINNLVIANPPTSQGLELTSEVSNSEITTNAIAGKAILPAGNSELKIINSKLKIDSLVYITPLSDTDNKVLFVKSKGEGFFTVGFSKILNSDVEFNWWIINLKQ